MRVNGPVVPSASLPETIGRLLRGGAIRAPSVETPDVLELSALSQVASSLGSEGIAAVRSLTGSGTLSEERILAFIENLQQSGTLDSRTSQILTTLAGFQPLLGSGGLDTLFGEVESRGVSGDLRYLDELDNLFNLGNRDVRSLFNAGKNLSDEEFSVFLSSLVTLLKNGVVGTITVDYRGNPTKVFLSNEMASNYSRYPLYPERFGA